MNFPIFIYFNFFHIFKTHNLYALSKTVLKDNLIVIFELKNRKETNFLKAIITQNIPKVKKDAHSNTVKWKVTNKIKSNQYHLSASYIQALTLK